MVEQVGGFSFTLGLFKTKVGGLDIRKKVVNNNMLREILIMHLKALLNSLEKQYYDKNQYSL
jgi:hypothetical protein